jgi:hypothetical protein
MEKTLPVTALMRGMCISNGADTSPVENDRVSHERCGISFMRSPKFWICDTTQNKGIYGSFTANILTVIG